MSKDKDFYYHPKALVESSRIGLNTRVWAFAHILPGAKVGADCNICDHVFIENEVIIGDRVTVKCGVQLWDGVIVKDDVFIGPNATFTNDKYPRSKIERHPYPKTIIEKNASIGANSTILPGIVIGRNAMVGAGAVVTRDVPPNATVIGNPAQITGYASDSQKYDKKTIIASHKGNERIHTSSINGVQYLKLPIVSDMRGNLSFAEYGQYLPFQPKRYFLIYDVPNREVRGEHAHKTLHEFLVCVKGSCSVMVDDGSIREEYLLNSPNIALHLPPMVWGVQYKYTHDAILLVLASHEYDTEDYIRDYDEYLQLVKKK